MTLCSHKFSTHSYFLIEQIYSDSTYFVCRVGLDNVMVIASRSQTKVALGIYLSSERCSLLGITELSGVTHGKSDGKLTGNRITITKLYSVPQ